LFDLNGTLLDTSAIAEPLGGGPGERRLVAAAFQEALLLTMADTLSRAGWRPLPEYLRAALGRALLADGRELDALGAAMERAATMDPFPDAREALIVLRDAGLHTGILTNSTTETAEAALESAGLRDLLEIVIGNDAVQSFKPDPRVYEHGVAELGVAPGEICLVAAHAWDVVGAMRAGLRGAWVARGEPWPAALDPEPDARGEELTDVARALADR
jgi:2-haloacid dehalogenase